MGEQDFCGPEGEVVGLRGLGPGQRSPVEVKNFFESRLPYILVRVVGR